MCFASLSIEVPSFLSFSAIYLLTELIVIFRFAGGPLSLLTRLMVFLLTPNIFSGHLCTSPEILIYNWKMSDVRTLSGALVECLAVSGLVSPQLLAALPPALHYWSSSLTVLTFIIRYYLLIPFVTLHAYLHI